MNLLHQDYHIHFIQGSGRSNIKQEQQHREYKTTENAATHRFDYLFCVIVQYLSYSAVLERPSNSFLFTNH